MIPHQLDKPEFGFCLLKPGQKIPFEKDWQKNPHRHNDEQLSQHIQKGGNYGLIGGYGQLRILDIDEPKLGDKLLDVLDTFTVKTGSGGYHFYFISDYSQNHVLGNGKGELRAHNYQCVGPGCTHPNGNKYQVIRDRSIKEVSGEWLSNKIKPFFRDGESGKQKVDYDKILQGVPKGERNHEFFRLACSLKSKKINKIVVLQQLLAINQQNKPPLPVSEIKQIVNSAFSYKDETRQQVAENIKGTNHDAIMRQVEDFFNNNPYIFDWGKLKRWNTNLSRYEKCEEIALVSDLQQHFGAIVALPANIRQEYITAIKLLAYRHFLKIKDKATPYHVQFGSIIYDTRDRGFTEIASPDWYLRNPIPWDVITGQETPVIDKFIGEWTGKESIKSQKQRLAYKIFPKNPLKLIPIQYGPQNSGKSQKAKIDQEFLGSHNYKATSYGILTDSRQRFELAELRDKLVVYCSEIEGRRSYETSTLKTLSGQDPIRAERKNIQEHDTFVFGGKIEILTNKIPEIKDLEDTAFMGRVDLQEYPNEFNPDGREPIDQIPDDEYNALAGQILEILYTWFADDKGITIDAMRDWKGRIEEYKARSNPLTSFVKSRIKFDEENEPEFSDMYIPSWKFREEFNLYLEMRGMEEWDSKKIGWSLKKGYEDIFYRKKEPIGENNNYVWVYKGMGFKGQISQDSQDSQGVDSISLRKGSSKTLGNNGKNGNNDNTEVLNNSILDYLEKYDHPEGIKLETLALALARDAEELHSELLKLSERGDVVQIKPDYWRIIK